MRPEDALRRLGGVATLQTLRVTCTRHAIRTAVKEGTVIRDGHGRYALPGSDEARRAASRLSGVVSHLSAARLFGWELKSLPAEPQVVVARNRRVADHRRTGVRVRWADLTTEEVSGDRTTPVRTVLDCAKDLPFDEALSVADSALRHGTVTRQALLRAAETLPVRHRRRCLGVVGAADGRAANPFESTLRAIALGVRGLRMEPQVVLVQSPALTIRADLVDEARGIVAEADSFEWHGGRRALVRDCERYNVLLLRGLLVLRFSWEDVMFRRSYVLACLTAATRLRQS